MASEPTDLLQALKDSLVRRCRDCDEPVDVDGVTLTDECCETCCDGTCPEYGCPGGCSDDCMADHKGEQ